MSLKKNLLLSSSETLCVHGKCVAKPFHLEFLIIQIDPICWKEVSTKDHIIFAVGIKDQKVVFVNDQSFVKLGQSETL